MSMDIHPTSLENLTPYRALKVAVIREEFMALTHDPMVAIVLNQLVYWSLRVKDFDLFLKEERQFNPACNVLPRHGWIYKTAEDLIGETMLKVSKSTMMRYLSVLHEAGWLDKRSNAANKWDKTLQYRVNLRKLQEDLLILGYTLPGFCVPPTSQLERTSSSRSAVEKTPAISKNRVENSLSSPNDAPKFQNDLSMFQNETSRFQNETCSTEITTETTNRDSSSSSLSESARKTEHMPRQTSPLPSDLKKREEDEEEQKNEMREEEDTLHASSSPHAPETPNLPEAMLESWNRHIAQQSVQMTEARRELLTSLAMGHLQSDITEWEGLCERIKANRFLMGGGPSGWRISLDWILNSINFMKVQEGQFYASEKHDSDKETSECLSPTGEISPMRQAKIQAILDTFKDPVWRSWCSQLDLSTSRGAVHLFQLDEISQARFVEVEDDRLVLIGCPDQTTCRRIEELRCPLLSIVHRTYPSVRAVLAHVEEGESESSPQASPLSAPNPYLRQ